MIPIVLFLYKRIDTTKKVWSTIQAKKPHKLYLIADGPKNLKEEPLCSKVRDFVESNVNWQCEIIKIYSNVNLGCARRIQTGLDKVFENEEMAIILEDDTLLNQSFFDFCEELLERYKNDKSVVHISGCNPHLDAVKFKESYCFSSIVNIWGWATWKRAWENYNINMPSWQNQDKSSFLKHWIPSIKERKGMRKMLDLHCNNKDPWTWDYQWVYACWKTNGFSVSPSCNMVSNLGIGPNASNTKSHLSVEMYPSTLDKIPFPLTHPLVERNTDFEIRYYRASQLPLFRRIKNQIKSFL